MYSKHFDEKSFKLNASSRHIREDRCIWMDLDTERLMLSDAVWMPNATADITRVRLQGMKRTDTISVASARTLYRPESLQRAAAISNVHRLSNAYRLQVHHRVHQQYSQNGRD